MIRASMVIAATAFEWAQLVGAAFAVVVAGLVAFMPYARRPRLGIEEDKDGSNSRVESSDDLGGLPHVRLLVTNRKWRRAAHGTRVLVEGYTPTTAHAATLTTLGHPSLEWPSAPDADAGAVTVFGGGVRPITLGYLVLMRRDPNDGKLHSVRESDQRRRADAAWFLRLTIGLAITDQRDHLPPVEDGYRVRLIVGADDGAARAFDVHINWDGDYSRSPAQVLRSALDRLSVP